MFLDSSRFMEYSGDSHYFSMETVMAEKFEFRVVTELDVLKTHLFSKCRLTDTGCWEWIGAKDAHGYGFVNRGNRTWRAHRISYEAYIGPIPDGLHVLHSCDNPSCISPNHLSVGTAKQNMAEREARGRRDVKGEQIGTSKLTAHDVREIRASSLSLDELAEKYGVHRTNVWAIRARKSWKHLE
jgi:hypothetical protein